VNPDENLADRVRERIARGALPPGRPPKVQSQYGDGTERCSVCDEAIGTADLGHEFLLRDFGVFRFHSNCYQFWVAGLLERGWLKVE
jgi:hypothetical protein